MQDNPFKLQKHIDYLYDNTRRRLAFNTQTPEGLKVWRQELRSELYSILGLAGRILPEIKAEKVNEADKGEYIEEKYALTVEEKVTIPIYILIPKNGEQPFKTVLVFHGHNPSVQHILGNYDNEEEAEESRARDGNYAQVLARKGFLVCAVEQRGFGERKTDNTEGGPFLRSCRHLSFDYMMLGRTMIGERCWDGMRAVDYLQTRDDVQKGSLGCTGNSGGGTTCLWLSAIDERITVAVPSCYFCSFKHSIFSLYHCDCNYVPGILRLAEMGDIAAMIAPRPLRIIAGEKDDIFPVEGVREQLETVRRAYGVLKVKDKCSLAIHLKEHQYSHSLAYEWFSKWL